MQASAASGELSLCGTGRQQARRDILTLPANREGVPATGWQNEHNNRSDPRIRRCRPSNGDTHTDAAQAIVNRTSRASGGSHVLRKTFLTEDRRVTCSASRDVEPKPLRRCIPARK